jgi:hypothetical protein
LCPANRIFPSVAPTLAPIFSAIRDTYPAQPMLLDLVTWLIEREVRATKFETSHYATSPVLLLHDSSVQMYFSALFTLISSVCLPSSGRETKFHTNTRQETEL